MKKIEIKPKQRRMLLIGAVAVLLALFLLPGRKKRPEVSVQPVVRCDLEETVPASGLIRPVIEVKISPDVSGEIVDIFAAEGDRVEAGDLVLKIRQDLYLSQVEQAGASLGSLKAQYARQRAEARQAQLEWERSRKLMEQDAISDAEYQNAKTAFEIARSSLKAAEYAVRSGEAQLGEAQENLLKTTVYAPITGIVSRMNVEKGERVVGTSQMAGTELFRIADFSRMEVVVDVGENDVVRIRPDDSVRVEIDAYPHRVFRGLVTQIANSAKNMDDRFDQVINFGVRIEVLPDSATFLPGMSASVNIVTSRRFGCLAIPVESVFLRGNDPFVWLLGPDGTVAARKVVTGIQQHDRIEVLEGLTEDDTVVSGPPEAIEKRLTEGQRVKPITTTGWNPES